MPTHGFFLKILDRSVSQPYQIRTLCSTEKGVSFRIGLVSQLTLSFRASNQLHTALTR